MRAGTAARGRAGKARAGHAFIRVARWDARLGSVLRGKRCLIIRSVSDYVPPTIRPIMGLKTSQ